MKILNLEKIDRLDSDTAIALGFYDGIHVGHKKILSAAIEAAKKKNLASAIFTFARHPMEVINPGLCFPYLTTFDEKISIAGKIGLDYFIYNNFTPEFSHITPEQFVHGILLKKLRGKLFAVGNDYRFGCNAEGNVGLLKKYAEENDAEVEVISEVRIDNERVGSTLIRESIMTGDLEKANRFLGRWYSLEGTVIEGRKIGRELGFPTANIEPGCEKVIPRPGIYCVVVLLDGKIYQGAGFLGSSQTFHDSRFNLEVNIFNHDENIYGKKLRVFFARHLRDIIKFPDKESLIDRINLDIRECKKFFKNLDEDEILRNISSAPADISYSRR